MLINTISNVIQSRRGLISDNLELIFSDFNGLNMWASLNDDVTGGTTTYYDYNTATPLNMTILSFAAVQQ